MATWKGNKFLDALVQRLEARPGLSGIEVNRAPMGTDAAKESITFFGVEGNQEHAALGDGAKRDAFNVEAAIFIVKAGSGNAVAKEAADRAEALMAEVEDEVRSYFATGKVDGHQITSANLTDIRLDQGANPDGRVAVLSFLIEVVVRI
jgi:hypothetical protein